MSQNRQTNLTHTKHQTHKVEQGFFDYELVPFPSGNDSSWFESGLHPSPFPVHLGLLECFRIIWMSITVGIVITLAAFCLISIWQGSKYRVDYILQRVAFYLVFMAISDVTDFLLFFDFYFLQSINYNDQTSQTLANIVEFSHLGQRYLILGMGVAELFRLYGVESWSIWWNSSPIALWILYTSVGLLVPLLMVYFRSWSGDVSALHHMEFLFIPFLISGLTSWGLYRKGRRLNFHLSLDESLAIKLMIFYLLIVFCESIEFLIIDEAVWLATEGAPNHDHYQLIYVIRDGAHELNHFLFPIGYFLFISPHGNHCWKCLPSLNNPSLTRLPPRGNHLADRGSFVDDIEMGLTRTPGENGQDNLVQPLADFEDQRTTR